jgi:phosphoglycerate dehydrogenase-like enzyme
MPKVVLADTLPPFVAQQLQALLPEGVELDAIQANTDEELARRAAESDVLLTGRSKVDARTLALIPRVRFIQQIGVGYDNLDIAALEAAAIPAANNPGFNTSSVADHTIMLMLVLLHQFVGANDATRSGEFPTMAFVGTHQAQLRELGDETVGLVSFGNIGRAVAECLRGFKSRVLYFAPHRVDYETEAQLGVQYAPFYGLLAGAGIVSLHLPSTPETQRLIGSAELAQMQPDAFLINTSRGDLVDEAALRQAIQGGHLAGAGLDVLAYEMSEINPFSDLPEVIVTPHTAGISRTNASRALRLAAANIGRFLRGEPVLNLVTR